MSEKHLKEIAKELKIIRRELQKINKNKVITIDGQSVLEEVMKEEQPLVIKRG